MLLGLTSQFFLCAIAIKILQIHTKNQVTERLRVERANKTLQDRLIKEMRLMGISSIEEANKHLDILMKKYNDKFEKEPESEEDAHLENTFSDEELNRILSIQTTRKVMVIWRFIKEIGA